MELRILMACIAISAVERYPRMHYLEFFANKGTSLKICGVTVRSDAEEMAAMGVHAVGFNFWPLSKRYLNPEVNPWMKGLAGGILRVGVFVNEDSDLPYRLYGEGMIDVVQLHGDETLERVGGFRKAGIPVIKAVGVRDISHIEAAGSYGSDAVLLDAHAPQVFGGTGETFDWGLANAFGKRFPAIPMILAGGITAENAGQAVEVVRPVAIDVASGAEISPGIKDFGKVAALLEACVSPR